MKDDAISRQGVLKLLSTMPPEEAMTKALLIQCVQQMNAAQSDLGKYEYHYDHTDCIYYSSKERHTCPSTCAQYRDGWNDAMQYIFRGGDGYRPYRRDEKYEE